jgi:hypothetical protein
MKNSNLSSKIRAIKNIYAAWSVVGSSALTSKSREIRAAAEQFKVNAYTNCKRIQDELLREYRKGSYEFSEARPTLHKGSRPVIIPTIKDRIVQRAILQILQEQDGIKALVETEHSFGGIKDKGVELAIREVVAAQKNGARYFIRSDIVKFFYADT